MLHCYMSTKFDTYFWSRSPDGVPHNLIRSLSILLDNQRLTVRMEASQINTTKKLGHRRFKDGEVTYKAVETTKLMSSIQLGVRSSLADIANKEDMDLVRADFDRVDTVDIKKSGNLQQFKVGLFFYGLNYFYSYLF